MAGMFRGGHKRPTFDTPVEFISVNQTATDKSGGYGSPQITRGAWGEPEVMTEQTVATRDDFVPTGDSGVQATTLGIFAWHTEGDTQTLLYQQNDHARAYSKTRAGAGAWSSWSEIRLLHLRFVLADRSRSPLPAPAFVSILADANDTASKGFPRISAGLVPRMAILTDDATGQSLYYCNDQLTPPRCEHYRRAIDDGTGPASRTYYADVKDVAGAERTVGDIAVAVSTKSLVFAHATLKPLLDSGSITKDWKVRINGRDMDITGVMDGWVPNRYSRLIVEDRT